MRITASVALRFVLEFSGVIALAYWGLHAASTMPLQALLAVVAPVVLIIIWALFIAPRAVYPIPRLAQAIAGGLLLEVAALALVVAGQPTVGLVFAALIAIDTAALAVSEAGR